MSQAFDAARARVLVGSKAGKTERFAARELAKEIGARTGRAPSVMSEKKLDKRTVAGKLLFILGTRESSDLVAGLIGDGKCKGTSEEQGYTLRTIPNPLAATGAAIVIVGADERGVLYGVRDLQHYYLEDDSGKIVAGRLNVTSFPKIKVRGAGLWDYYTVDPFAYVDQMSRWKLNALMICPWKYIYDHYGIIEYAHERGVAMIWGDGIYSYHYVGFGNHNQWAILPEEAPAEIKRSPDKRCLCPSDPKTIPWMTRYALEVIEKLPGLDGVGFQTGNLDKHECHCEECSGLSASEYFLMELNPVVSAIADRYPHLGIGYGLGHNMIRDEGYKQAIRKVDKRAVLGVENRYPMPNAEDMDILEELVPGNWSVVAKLYGSRGQLRGWRERRRWMFDDMFECMAEAARRGARGVSSLIQTRLYHAKPLYIANMYSEGLWNGGAPPAKHRSRIGELSDLDQRVSDPKQQMAKEGNRLWLIKYPDATKDDWWVPWPMQPGTRNISDLLSGEESASYQFRMPAGWAKGLKSAELVIKGAKDDMEGVESGYRFDISINNRAMRNLACPWNKGGDVQEGRYTVRYSGATEWRMEVPKGWLDDRLELKLHFRDPNGMVMYDKIAIGLEYDKE